MKTWIAYPVVSSFIHFKQSLISVSSENEVNEDLNASLYIVRHFSITMRCQKQAKWWSVLPRLCLNARRGCLKFISVKDAWHAIGGQCHVLEGVSQASCGLAVHQWPPRPTWCWRRAFDFNDIDCACGRLGITIVDVYLLHISKS